LMKDLALRPKKQIAKSEIGGRKKQGRGKES